MLKLNDSAIARIHSASTSRLRVTLAQNLEAQRHPNTATERQRIVIDAITAELATRLN